MQEIQYNQIILSKIIICSRYKFPRTIIFVHSDYPIKKYINISIYQFQSSTTPPIRSKFLKSANLEKKILLILDIIKNGRINSNSLAAKVNILYSIPQIYIYIYIYIYIVYFLLQNNIILVINWFNWEKKNYFLIELFL